MNYKSRVPSPESRVSLEYDIIIVGGGLVGASLACALGAGNARIAVVEAVPPRAVEQPSYDDRALALALSSRNILESINVWQSLGAQACPIRSIHVSDRGHFGFVRLHARDANSGVLGYVITARELGLALTAAVSDYEHVDFLCPAKTSAVDIGADRVTLKLEVAGKSTTLYGKLLVAADGAGSATCRQLGIPVRSKDYGQSAIIANISTEKPHEHIAYERFTDTGPLALLPLPDQRCKLVFTVRSEAADHYMQMDDAQFLEATQARFGRRLGKFTRIGRRHSYPLMLIEAEQQIRERVVLLGNAAHTVHPNGAQGLNLCLRDVAALASRLLPALEHGADPGDTSLLEQYLAGRLEDQRRIIRFTDGLASLFYDQQPFKVMARNGAMIVMDLFPVLKRKLLSFTMGIGANRTAMMQ